MKGAAQTEANVHVIGEVSVDAEELKLGLRVVRTMSTTVAAVMIPNKSSIDHQQRRLIRQPF